MSVPFVVKGTPLEAFKVNPRVIIKKKDEIRTNTNTLTTDSELHLPVIKGHRYSMTLWLWLKSSTKARFLYQPVAPIEKPHEGRLLSGHWVGWDDVQISNRFMDAVFIPSNRWGSNSYKSLILTGTFPASADGEFEFKWCQSTPTNDECIVGEGSTLMLLEATQ